LNKISKRVQDSFFSALVLMMATVLLVVGYLVAPVLFSALPAKQAGDIAGTLFALSSTVLVLGLSGICLFKLFKGQALSVKSLWIALGILLVLKFFISPWMAVIKSAYPLGLTRESADFGLFMSIHGAYQLGYLAIVILLLTWSYSTISKGFRA